MKYLHLIWAALFRRKGRTFLTLVSIITAFLLFGLLDAVRVGFDQAGKSANGAQRLQTSAKLSFIQLLPMSLGARIEQTDGVKDVAYANWFGGAYQKPENAVFSFAVSPNYIDVYPEMEVSAAHRKAFAETKDGLPFFGAHADVGPRVLFAMAYGGNGITYSAIGAWLIRAAIERRKHPLASLFSFGRVG